MESTHFQKGKKDILENNIFVTLGKEIHTHQNVKQIKFMISRINTTSTLQVDLEIAVKESGRKFSAR